MASEGLIHETRVRVRYAEVDRMGVAWHGHYVSYFEQGRTELLRSLGATYRQVEDEGTLLVVTELGLRFLRPASYDDELTIRTTLASVRGVRLRFEYQVLREERLLAEGHTVLAACDVRGRPRRIPASLAILVDPQRAEDRKSGAPGAVQGAGVAPSNDASAAPAQVGDRDRGETC